MLILLSIATFALCRGSPNCLRGIDLRRGIRSWQLRWAIGLFSLLTYLSSAGVTHAQFRWPPGHALHRAAGGAAAGQVVSTQPHRAVARIIVPEKDGQSYGSGTLVDVNGQHGLVISNWHVVRDASAEITVVFPDGFRSPAQVVKVDQDWDLAALSINRPTMQPVMVSTASPQPGDNLTIAGYGSGRYQASAGKCTQFLAPAKGLPYELVEVSAEARQGDSGGPIFNDRGEIAGVLFGSGPGYTSGSYAPRVREFLATVIPVPADLNRGAIAGAAPQSPVVAPLGGEQTVPSYVPPPASTATAGFGPPTYGATSGDAPTAAVLSQGDPAFRHTLEATTTQDQGPRNPPPSLPPYAFAPPASAPRVAADPPTAAASLQPAPLIAETSRGFESEPPLTPVRDTTRTIAGDSEEPVDPRTAVVLQRPVERRNAASSFADDRPMASSRQSSSSVADETMTDERMAMVQHAPLPPRAGIPTADLGNASADQLLSVAWRRIGGVTFWDQAKTVLAIVGMLTLFIQFWRFNSRSEPHPDGD